MAVNYGVPVGKTFMISGPANVSVTGGEYPMIVDSAEEYQATAPVITLLDPDTAVSGDPDLTLTITGERFTADTVIVFGDLDEPTTFHEDGSVSTGVKPSLFAPAEVPVRVRNGPARSNAEVFTFTAPAAAGRGVKTKKGEDRDGQEGQKTEKTA